MARLVGGVGASHSPQLSIPADGWRPHGDMDGERLQHLPPTRRYHDDIVGELDSDLFIKRYEKCQTALGKTGAALAEMQPDVLVVIGDDQRELFLEDIMPAISIFWVPTPIRTRCKSRTGTTTPTKRISTRRTLASDST
jgi:hypothetical protein